MERLRDTDFLQYKVIEKDSTYLGLICHGSSEVLLSANTFASFTKSLRTVGAVVQEINCRLTAPISKVDAE